MKAAILILISLCMFKISTAQQRPQYTQYIFNNYLLNPALSGIENYTDVKAGYRKQWEGLNGAPVTSYLSVHLPLGRQYLFGNSSSFEEKGNDPMSRSYLQNYMAAEPHHGVGAFVVSDKTGPIAATDLKLTYAYHLGLTARMNLSFGIAAGISRVALDVSEITLENNTDQAIGASYVSSNKPDLGAGVWLYGPVYFVGLSAQQLLSRPVSFSSDPNYNKGRQVPHVFATAGYRFFFSDDIAAVPSVLLKYISPAPLSADVNLKIAFKDKFWIGGSYRKDDALAVMAGFNIGSLFVLGYSYDFTTSSLSTVSTGTHEIMLGILLNNRYKVTCPQRMGN